MLGIMHKFKIAYLYPLGVGGGEDGLRSTKSTFLITPPTPLILRRGIISNILQPPYPCAIGLVPWPSLSYPGCRCKGQAITLAHIPAIAGTVTG
jgi:hypothetical protein